MNKKTKTNKSAAKRFKVTATGKVKFNRAGKGHLLLCKNRKRKRKLRGGAMLDHSELKKVSRMMPYA